MVEIADDEELRLWLKGQPIEVAALISARAALRVAPALIELFAPRKFSDGIPVALSMFRVMLNSSVAGTWPTLDLRLDARAAYAPEAARRAFAANAAHAAYAIDAARAAAEVAGVTDAARAAARCAYAVDAARTVNASTWAILNADIREVETGTSLKDIRQSSLWWDSLPEEVESQWNAIDNILREDRSFDFWRKWYQSVLDGEPQNWEMLQQIVLIDEETWASGPDAVAERIAKIEAKYTPKTIPKTILREQVTVLFQNAILAQMSGDSLALQIEDAITSYLREEECNGLPEDLSVLEHLPAALRRLTSAVSAAQNDENRVEELALAIQSMASEIQALRDQLETLQSAPPDSPFLKSFKEQSGKSLGDWKMWGALISGSYLLLGEPAIGATLTQVTESLKALIGRPPT